MAENGRQEMLIPAHTPQQAIDLARRYWGVRSRFLRVETVREPNAGWLCFGRRHGLYRAVCTLPPNERSPEEQPMQMLAAKDAPAMSAAAPGTATEDTGNDAERSCLPGGADSEATLPSIPLPAAPFQGSGRASVREGAALAREAVRRTWDRVAERFGLIPSSTAGWWCAGRSISSLTLTGWRR